MSDAMSRQEIDDVLSSVRRLVARETSRVPADRLVLTPALRVPPEPEPEREPEPEPEAQIPPVASADAAPHWSEAARPATGVAPADMPSDAPTAATVAATAPAETESPHGPVEGLQDAQVSSPATVDLEQLRATLDALDIAAGGGRIDAATAAAADHDGGDESSDDGGDTAPADTTGDTAPAHGLDAGPAWQGLRDYQSPDDAAPHAGGAIPEMNSDPGADAYPDAELAPGSDAEMLETVIDEDMLRVLVAQIVREELRGQLGARVTTQVRKLVRAEVTRLLEERPYL